MMNKNRRQKAIREIIDQKNIVTQYQLTEELLKHGFAVTQATISRDIKEMGLIKTSFGENSFRYSYPQGISGNSYERAKKMLRDDMLRISVSNFIVVIKTLPGTAQGVAFCLDGLGWKEILGSVAGDDSIMIITSDNANAKIVAENLTELSQ